jgi:hyperosmotically inducible protein
VTKFFAISVSTFAPLNFSTSQLQFPLSAFQLSAFPTSTSQLFNLSTAQPPSSDLFPLFSRNKGPSWIAPAFQQCRQSTANQIYMKQITVSFLCLSAFALSAMAQEGTSPDNTGNNKRDRSGETQTSGDQSNNPQDIKMSAAIRRAVVSDKSLSATAKNIKIITANETITLRGPVKTAEEKTKIEQLAQSAAGNAKIDNQLEVEASK